MTAAELKDEWRQFRDDPPGHRFRNHHDRMRKKSSAVAVASTALGVLLLLGGIALLFIPGPGLLVMVFGLALLAGRSRRLSGVLDRAEPPVRRAAKRVRRTWKRLPVIAKVGIGVVALAAVAAAAYGAWRLWFAG